MMPSAVPTAAYAPGKALSAIARWSTAWTLSRSRVAWAAAIPGTAVGRLVRGAHPPNDTATDPAITDASANIVTPRRLRKAGFGAFVHWRRYREATAGESMV